MTNNLPSIQQNTTEVLSKTKNLMGVANKILAKKDELSFNNLTSEFQDTYEASNNDLLLISIVKKKNNLYEGVFANINNDLNDAFQNLDIELNDNSTYEEKLLFMSYAYARRTAAAGLVLQGVFSIKDFQHTQNFFQTIQYQTIHTIEFQELASTYGHQYILSYDERLTVEILQKIVRPVLLNHSDDVKTAKDLGIYYSCEDILNSSSLK